MTLAPTSPSELTPPRAGTPTDACVEAGIEAPPTLLTPDLEDLIRQLTADPPRLRRPRETFPLLPLAVGVLASVLMHAALVPVAVLSVIPLRVEVPDEDDERLVTKLTLPKPEPREKQTSSPPPPALPDEEKIRLGQENGDKLSLAWIGHEDPRELLGRKSTVVQPGLQQQADPTENAPPELDATAPAPMPSEAASPAAAESPALTEPTPPTPDAPTGLGTSVPVSPAPASPPAPPAPAPLLTPERVALLTRLPDTIARAELPKFDRLLDAPPGPTQEAPEAPDTDAPETNPDGVTTSAPMAPTPEPTPTVQAEPAPPASTPPSVPSPPAHPAPATDARPTSSARADRESAPVNLVGSTEVRPGGVLARDGIEIKTVAPRFSAVTSVTAAPINPKADITFDTDGRVINVELTTKSGFENVDGPVIASLYKWRATGSKLRELTGPFTMTVTILLRGED